MFNYILIGLLLVSGLFLIVAVLMQQGKSKGMSGAIGGGSDTFFGKNNGSKTQRVLSKLTTIIGIIFVLAVLAVYVFQVDRERDNEGTQSILPSTSVTTSDVADN